MSIKRSRVYELYILDSGDRTSTNFPDLKDGTFFFERDSTDLYIVTDGDFRQLAGGGGGGVDVSSVFGRTGVVVAHAQRLYLGADRQDGQRHRRHCTSRSHTDLLLTSAPTLMRRSICHIADTRQPAHSVTAAQAGALASFKQPTRPRRRIATARTNLGLVAGGAGDIWVEKAGDTMTGNLLISGGSLAVTGAITATAGLIVEGAAIFNSAGGVFDFRIDADAVDSIFFVDASEDRIGIGTSSPVAPFHAALSEAFNPWGSVSGGRTGYAWFGDGTSSTDIMIQSNGRSAITFDNGSQLLLTFGCVATMCSRLMITPAAVPCLC
jgi:hypothetical protein